MAGYFPAPGINENDLAYVEKGDYASQAIPKGAFVEWNGKVRTAKAAILQGATLSASLFDDVNSGGALNQISDHIDGLNTFARSNPTFTNNKFTPSSNGILILGSNVASASAWYIYLYEGESTFISGISGSSKGATYECFSAPVKKGIEYKVAYGGITSYYSRFFDLGG